MPARRRRHDHVGPAWKVDGTEIRERCRNGEDPFVVMVRPVLPAPPNLTEENDMTATHTFDIVSASA